MRSASAEDVAAIYDAAVDDDLWPHFGKVIGRATGIETVSVWIIEDGQFGDTSIDPAYRELVQPYRENFSKLDPWSSGLRRHPPGTVMLGLENMDEKTLVKTEFYNDWARHGGMFRPIGVRMQLAPRVYATMGSDNPFAKRLFEVEDKLRIERLLPQIKSALQLRRRVGHSVALAEAAAATLDALQFGVVVCDRTGRVLFANAEAEALARDRAGIAFGATPPTITALRSGESTRLAALIHSAGMGGPGGAMVLGARTGLGPLFALVTALTGRLNTSDEPGRVMVSLRKASGKRDFTETLLASLFGMTPREAALAIDLYEGKTLDEIAAAKGVKITTLRTHLASIFLKTGADSQRELVRLISRLPPVRSIGADSR